ncbi:MAG: hypothetical protein J4F29_19015 [Candidatus Latescibacteria bacterium]|nr:hypothetical protein [Candidatus Latescibacterota bacterium]
MAKIIRNNPKTSFSEALALSLRVAKGKTPDLERYAAAWFLFSLIFIAVISNFYNVAGVFIPLVIIFLIITWIIFFRKKRRIANVLQQLDSAAITECNFIKTEMQSAVAKASAERDKQVADAGLRRDQAMAYIEQEYQSFDERLCLCLDKFQSLLDDWSKMNANVVSLLDENRVQYLSENNDQIGPRQTRVGTTGIRELGRNWLPHGVTPRDISVQQGHDGARDALRILE